MVGGDGDRVGRERVRRAVVVWTNMRVSVLVRYAAVVGRCVAAASAVVARRPARRRQRQRQPRRAAEPRADGAARVDGPSSARPRRRARGWSTTQQPGSRTRAEQLRARPASRTSAVRRAGGGQLGRVGVDRVAWLPVVRRRRPATAGRRVAGAAPRWRGVARSDGAGRAAAARRRRRRRRRPAPCPAPAAASAPVRWRRRWTAGWCRCRCRTGPSPSLSHAAGCGAICARWFLLEVACRRTSGCCTCVTSRSVRSTAGSASLSLASWSKPACTRLSGSGE